MAFQPHLSPVMGKGCSWKIPPYWHHMAAMFMTVRRVCTKSMHWALLLCLLFGSQHFTLVGNLDR
eukprot:3571084-Amphidinium_carterae.1